VGLGIELQDEFGGTVDSLADPKNLLTRLLPPVLDDSYPMLGSIDRYGDTVFNNLQMKRFLLEWADVVMKAGTSEERDVVQKIGELANRCQQEVHRYLKFIGD
jgi:hypothetical protein